LPVRWRHILKPDILSGLQLFQLFRYGSVLIVAILLPQIGFSRAEIGIYEVFLFFAGVVTFFWLTGLIQGFLPAAISRRDASPELFNAALLLFLFSVLAALVLWLLHPLLQQLLDQQLPADLLGWLMLYLVLFAPSTLVEYWYVMNGRTRILLYYGLLAYGFQIIAVGLPAILSGDIHAVLYGLLVAGCFRFIWMLLLVIRKGEWQISIPFWKKHLSTGLPIAVSVLLSGSAQYVDGFIVSARYNAGVFAVFRYGARELPLVALLAHALSNALVPQFKKIGQIEALQQLKQRSSQMISWMFPMTLILMITSYFLFPLLFKQGFVESAGVFNLYLLLVTSRLLFPQTILIAYEKTRILMTASAIELTVNIVLSLILVRFWGIRGVALATVLAYYLERIILVVFVRRVQGIRLQQYLHITQHLVWTLLLWLVWGLTELFVYPYLIIH